MLFYTTTYIGELHRRLSPPPETEAAALALEAEATRFGSRALFYSSLLALFANFALPYFVSESNPSPRGTPALSPGRKRRWWSGRQVHLGDLWVLSHAMFAACMFGTL